MKFWTVQTKDVIEIIQEKVRKNAEKYPVEKAYGHKEKYTEL